MSEREPVEERHIRLFGKNALHDRLIHEWLNGDISSPTIVYAICYGRGK